MIDTNKYEGHSSEYTYEIVSIDDDKEMDATYALLNDAPLLLARVIRLQSYIAHHEDMRTYARYRQCPECGSIDFTFKFDDEGMECECDKCDNIWRVKLE